MIEQLQRRLQAYEEKMKKKHEIEEQLLKMEINPKKREENSNKKRRHYIKEEVEVEVGVMVIDEVGILTTTTPIMEEEKAQPKDKAKATQDQGTTNPKYSAMIVKSLGIML